MTDEDSKFEWRLVVICGLLFGVVSSVAVTLTQATGDLGVAEWLGFVAKILPPYVLAGLVWAAGAKLVEDTARPVTVIMATAICAWVADIGSTSLLAAMIAPGNFGHLWPVPPFDIAIYNIWTSTFYGGLYVAGFLASRRNLGLRRRLAIHRLGRDEAEARLRETRLDTVRDQVQPDIILATLSALSRSLNSNARDRDRLFEPLIAFLRAVTPADRSEAATLPQQLEVLKRYAALRHALNTEQPRWIIRAPRVVASTPVPSLRLLPAVHRLSSELPQRAGVAVEGIVDEDAVILRISALANPPLPSRLIHLLRAIMRQELGTARDGGLSGSTVAEIRIPHWPSRASTPNDRTLSDNLASKGDVP